MTPHWEPLDERDLARLDAIQRIIHGDLPERLEFLAEKLAVFPNGCRKLVRGGEMVGYALSHPWTLGRVPALNASLHPLPAEPDCLHMHDVAILPEGRGVGAAGLYVDHLAGIARDLGIGSLACVSVYGTTPLWGSMGFVAPDPQPNASALESYGAATYMIAPIRPVREQPPEPA